MPPSALRRWSFRLAALAAMVLVVELFAFGAYRALYGAWFSPAATADARRAVAEPEPAADAAPAPKRAGARVPTSRRKEAIHPYLGFVWDVPGRRPQEAPDLLLNHGFRPQEARMARAAEEGVAHVAIFGGSVAENFAARSGGVELQRALEAMPRFAGKKVELQIFALAAWKQPQHLMALAYFLALGAHFDQVIVLDGVNEVAMPIIDNMPKHVTPYFPQAWYFRVAGLDRDERLALGELELVRAKRRAWARRLMARPWCYSVTAALVGRRIDEELERTQSRLEVEMQARAPSAVAASFAASGPWRPWPGTRALTMELARFWAQCSREMKALCDAHGIAYAHFLQPNQYASSKPMGAAEARTALREGSPWKARVMEGYPHLRREGEGLVKDGISFHDLTAVFENDPRALYTDSCCHINEQGDVVMAKAMARALR